MLVFDPPAPPSQENQDFVFVTPPLMKPVYSPRGASSVLLLAPFCFLFSSMMFRLHPPKAPFLFALQTGEMWEMSVSARNT